MTNLTDLGVLPISGVRARFEETFGRPWPKIGDEEPAIMVMVIDSLVREIDALNARLDAAGIYL